MEIVTVYLDGEKVIIEPPKDPCSRHVELEQLADARGMITFTQLNRCPKCGRWYRVD